MVIATRNLVLLGVLLTGTVAAAAGLSAERAPRVEPALRTAAIFAKPVPTITRRQFEARWADGFKVAAPQAAVDVASR